MPEPQLKPGHGAKTMDGKVIKIVNIINDNEVEGENAHPNEPDEVITISTDQIKELLTPHQLGQVKRFLPGGTGFSKLGRKLQKNHTREAVIESFIRGEIDGDELLEQGASAKKLGDAIDDIADDEIDGTVRDTLTSIIGDTLDL